MEKGNDLRILQKTEDMILYANKALEQFPRSERYALAPQARSRALKGTRTAHGAKGTHLPTKRRSQRRKAKNWIAVKAVSRRKPNSATHGIFLWRSQHETDRQHLRDNLQF